MTLHDLELKVSQLLRIGVLTAGVILALGWLWSVAIHGADLFQFAHYQPVPLLDSLRQGLQTRDFPSLIVYFGLAVLVLLPVARVLITGVLFLIQREWILGAVAVFVFCVLVTSFFLGTSL